MAGEPIEFDNGRGQRLAAVLERPTGESPRVGACFAHCFTCSKDFPSAVRISRALCQHGVAVLRFDFTGLGESEGEFGQTTFSSNVDDLLAAAAHLRAACGVPPRLLVGHSFGGSAAIAAAARVEEARAVATIAAPSDLAHVMHLIRATEDEVEQAGEVTITIGGRTFRIGRAFVQDLRQHRLEDYLQELGRALLVMHSPSDTVVDIGHARRIFEAARHPKSFVSLDRANHLLSERADAEYAAAVLATWASRYID